MALLCERCKREIYKYVICDSCGKKICERCVKSSQKATKTVKQVICKDCWSDLKKRSKYKSKEGIITKQPEIVERDNFRRPARRY